MNNLLKIGVVILLYKMYMSRQSSGTPQFNGNGEILTGRGEVITVPGNFSKTGTGQAQQFAGKEPVQKTRNA